MQIIHYICNYDDYKNHRHLNTQPSSVTKINYIISALKKSGFYVQVFSTAECVSDVHCVNLSCRKTVDEQESVLYQFTFGRTNLFLKILSRILINFQLLIYLLKLKKDDKVLIYHSLAIRNVIKFVLKICKRNVCFEIEELYTAVYGQSKCNIQKEIEYLKGANGYVFVNDMMQKKTGIEGLSAVCYGSYEIQNFHNPRSLGEGIHIVYAGVISGEGSDVYLAVDIARYLSSNYVIHILGYGLKDNISNLIRYIHASNKQYRCKVKYEGCLLGDQYLNFLSKCHIGLCTRLLEDDLSDYTFPSKIMVYIANQLIPVCTPISCVIDSKVRKYVVFSTDVSAKSIGKAILNVDFSVRNEYANLLVSLNDSFVNDLKKVFLCV